MNTYTLDTLTQINNRFCADHHLKQSDVDKANKYAELISKTRDDKHIMAGDIIEITNKYGEYYKYAHVETYERETKSWSVCEQPYTPFVFLGDNDEIKYNTSGGAWCSIPNNLRLIGRSKKFFKTWGNCGACANGAITFEAEVNVWEYKEENLMYGEYTTKDWRRYFISYCVDKYGNPKNESPYRYFGDGIAFVTKEDYEAWLNTYRGIEFKGHSDNQTVVFCYREKSYLISKEEWDKLDLPKDIRLCNGVNLCKVKYDEENHIVHVYRFDNAGNMDWKRYKPYELARGRDLTKEGF